MFCAMGLAFVSAQSLSFLKSWNVLRPYIYAVYICIKSSDVQSFWIVKFHCAVPEAWSCTGLNPSLIAPVKWIKLLYHTWWNCSESIIKLIISIRAHHKTDDVLQNRHKYETCLLKLFILFFWMEYRCISPVVLLFFRCFRILAN